MKGEVAVGVEGKTGGRNSRKGRLDLFSWLPLPTWMPAGPKPDWFGLGGFCAWFRELGVVS